MTIFTSDFAFYAVLILAAAACLGLLFGSVVLASQAQRQEPLASLVLQLRARLRLPILDDECFARRIAGMIAAPAINDCYQLSISVEGDYGQDNMAAEPGDEAAIRVVVDAQFSFLNVSNREVTLSLNLQEAKDRLGLGVGVELTALSINGSPVNIKSGAAENMSQIKVPSMSECRVHSRSVRYGATPYVALFAQNLMVRKGAVLRATSSVRPKVRLLVGDGAEYSLESDDWWNSADIWESRMTVERPLLSGEVILLSVGI
ncbi:hypothetical protein [Roseomonas harenae]|uniref:hypothetical protein n=1 Tax=Muricoccus harenae TaxID=2692566 RepID=UPI0013314E04|nr:hypothetical protein [Roseomonas harenae]